MLKMSSDNPSDGDRNTGQHRHVLNGQTMGTRYSAIIMSEDTRCPEGLERALFEAVDQVDRQMSTWKPESDLMKLNRTAAGVWTNLPEELFRVLEEAIAINRASSGLFDPALGDIVDAWGFGASSREPDAQTIRTQLGQKRATTYELLEFDTAQRAVRKKAQMKLDLCGIAKGYGVDAMAKVLDDFGIESGLVGIDGDMRAVSAKPDGAPWNVALEKPDYNMREALGMVELEDAAIATSGDYRHCLKIGGQSFSHTMDPRLGGPLQNDVSSVSVISDSCMTADAWATALMVMGADAGLHVAQAKGINALFLLREGNQIRQVAAGPIFGGK